MKEQEIFKSLDKYPGYAVSNYGRVKRLQFTRDTSETPPATRVFRERVIIPSKQFGSVNASTQGRAGYVRLMVDNKMKYVSVAQLVAEAWLPTYSVEDDVLRFVDGDSTNVRANNLIRFPKYLAYVEKHLQQPARYATRKLGR